LSDVGITPKQNIEDIRQVLINYKLEVNSKHNSDDLMSLDIIDSIIVAPTQAVSPKLDFDIFVYPFDEVTRFTAALPRQKIDEEFVTVIFTKKQGILYLFNWENTPKLDKLYFEDITQIFGFNHPIFKFGSPVLRLKYDKIKRFIFSRTPKKTYNIQIFDNEIVKK
jgi:hypothetical protein